MSDTYRGDTVGKKIARLVSWYRVIRGLGCPEFVGTPDDPLSPKCRFLYLASHEGGDASVLAALGVKPSQQVAADYDAEALAMFSARWPEIETRCCDVATLRRAPHERFAVINLDFCSHLSVELVDTIASVLKNCGRDNCDLVVAFMRGREKSDVMGDLERKSLDQRLDQPVEGVKDFVLKVGDTYSPDSGRGLIDGRLNFLLHGLSLRVPDRVAFVRNVITYQSRTSSSPGVPMVIVGLQIVMPKRKSAMIEFRRTAQRNLWLSRVHQQVSKKKDEAMCMSCDVSPFWSDEHLRQTALDWIGSKGWDSRTAALAFNIDPRTISAWKAHQTMGTYA